MRLVSLAPVTLAVLLSAGCGARTGEDELLTMDLTVDGATSGGGTSGAGGSGDGGTSGAGGLSSGGAPSGSCCRPSQGRGCAADRSIESCVCAEDAFCCNGAWDDKCVGLVESLGCGMCSLGTGGESTGGTGGQNTGGESTGGQSTGGMMGVGGGSGGSGGAPPGGDCCLPHASTGCFDQGIQDCVCETDEFCCDHGWDAPCVEQADQCGGGCFASGGAAGAGGTGGQGAGGDSDGGAGGTNPYCEFFPPASCEACACDACYEPLIACSNDTGCTCVLTSGCTSVMQCLSSDYCGGVLTAGTAGTSVARAVQLLTCESGAGCPCF